jgi:DNA-directed RNA polymerase subunit F
MSDEPALRYVSLAEVKHMLKKIEKDREDMTYEQRNSLDHANRFATLSMTKTKELISKLENFEFVTDKQAIKIADLLPRDEDDIRAIYAKERSSLKEGEIKQILDVVAEYYSQE